MKRREFITRLGGGGMRGPWGRGGSKQDEYDASAFYFPLRLTIRNIPPFWRRCTGFTTIRMDSRPHSNVRHPLGRR